MKTNTASERELISLTEATKYCNYSQEYLSLRARAKKLKSVKVGRNWMTTVNWLNEYVAKTEDYKKNLASQAAVVLPAAPVEVVPTPVIKAAQTKRVKTARKEKEAVVQAVKEKTVELEKTITPLVAKEILNEKSAPVVQDKKIDLNAVPDKKPVVPPSNLPIDDKKINSFSNPIPAFGLPDFRFAMAYFLTLLAVICVGVSGFGSIKSFSNDVSDYSSLFSEGVSSATSNISNPINQISASFSADADILVKKNLIYLDGCSSNAVSFLTDSPKFALKVMNESFGAVTTDVSGFFGGDDGFGKFFASSAGEIVKYDIGVFTEYFSWVKGGFYYIPVKVVSLFGY